MSHIKAMSKLKQLKTLLHAQGLWAKKSLGQNFLVDEMALDQIIQAAELSQNDQVVEVGPGTGFLTERLIREAGHVTSIELDSDMVQLLKKQFSLTKNLTMVEGDILKMRIKDYGLRTNAYKVVANIPYYITSPLIRHFLETEARPSLMVLLVQKEVAEKICALDGKSLITVQTAMFGKAEYIATVPANSFYPVPKVDSTILRIRVYDDPLIPEAQRKDFLRMVKFGFSQKRKKLSNSLGAGLHQKPAEVRILLEKAGLDPNVRAEALEIDDWRRLFKILNP